MKTMVSNLDRFDSVLARTLDSAGADSSWHLRHLAEHLGMPRSTELWSPSRTELRRYFERMTDAAQHAVLRDVEVCPWSAYRRSKP